MHDNLQFLDEYGGHLITVLILERTGGWITETTIRLGDDIIGGMVKDEFVHSTNDLARQAGTRAARKIIDQLNKTNND